MPQDAAEFDPDAAPPAAATGGPRPTYRFAIGGRLFTATCPKQTPYVDAQAMFERSDKAVAAENRLASPEAAGLPLTDRLRLEAMRDDRPGTVEIHRVFVEGWRDDDGLMRGGFLRWSLRPEDYAAIMRMKQPDSGVDVDVLDVFDLALELLDQFSPWIEQQAKAAGWALPNPERPRSSGRFGQAAGKLDAAEAKDSGKAGKDKSVNVGTPRRPRSSAKAAAANR